MWQEMSVKRLELQPSILKKVWLWSEAPFVWKTIGGKHEILDTDTLGESPKDTATFNLEQMRLWWHAEIVPCIIANMKEHKLSWENHNNLVQILTYAYEL